jgi:hypothetical protein
MLITSLWLNAFPVIGQTGATDGPFQIERSRNVSEVFAGMQDAGRDEPFAQALAKTSGDAGETHDALAAQGAYFYETFREGLGDTLAATIEKGIEINRSAYEKRKKAASAPPKAAPKRTTSRRNYGKSSAPFLPEIAVEWLADGPKITREQTPNSEGGTSTDVKVIDLPEAITTNTLSAGSYAIYNEKEMSLTALTKSEQKAETVSKTSPRKATKVTRMEWSTTMEWCPDAEGKVRGKAKARIFNQSTINTGTQLAAGTTEYSLEFHIIGQVNDDAVMPDFDMEGVVSEKIVGFDRGVKLGLLDEKPGLKDGSATIIYNIDNSTIAGSDITLGPVRAKLVGFETEAHVQRVGDFAKWGINTFLIDLEMLMKTSISRWTNGECVDVECTAPRNILKPGESVEVTATSVSKHDFGRINAKLNGGGTESVTPEDQEGEPSAVYTLTAPAKGQARFIAKSVSRRGIGLGMLEFDEAKKVKPPVKPTPAKTPDCDGGWTGTVKAVKTKRRDKQSGQDGRLVRQVESLRETYDAKVTVLGTRDLSGGIVNNFHGNAEGSFFSTKYSESNYAPGKMSCDKQIITTPQTHKMEIQEKGESNARVLVAIAINGGNRAYIGFTAPATASERIITRTYESSCPSYDAVNSGTERADYTIDRNGPFFEVWFEIDPSSPNVLKGSKTIQDSDGSETMITWDLSRCN